MSVDDSTYELIDAYLQGALPEGHPFVQRLQEDATLAEEVALRKLMQVAVVDYRLGDVEKLLAGRRKEFLNQNSKKWHWGFWALPLLMVGAAAYFYRAQPKQQQIVLAEKMPLKEHVVAQPKSEDLHKPVLGETTSASLQQTTKTTAAQEIAVIPVSPVLEPQEVVVAPLVENKPLTTPIAHEPERKVTLAPPSNTDVVNPCLGIHLKAYVQEERPCRGTSEGQLNIMETRGGKAPYQYAIDGKHFQEEGTFAGLKEDVYEIAVKDANGCETLVYEKYPLKSKTCMAYSEHIFNPRVHVWEVPNDLEKQGELAIFDENGRRVYDRSFGKSEKLNWTGVNNGGELLVPDVYIYSIKYSDGVVEQGKVTITY